MTPWNDSSLFVYQGAEALFRNRRALYILMFLRTLLTWNFLLLAQFLKAYLRRLCMNRVRFSLSMRCILLGNSFEPRSNSRVPNGTASPAHLFIRSINRRLQSKDQFDERKQDWLVQKFGFKGLTQFRKILFSSSSIKKNKQGGSTRSAGWAFRFCIMPLLKVTLFAPVPCNAIINKSSASHFCPVRIRIHSLY